MHARLPMATRTPLTVQDMPRPTSASKSSGSTMSALRTLAWSVMALAIGCSLADSAEPTAAQSVSFVAASPISCQLTTDILPSVRVPVLSKTTASTLCAICSAAADLMRTPWAAPNPVPIITAVGVASPSAQGHAITSTAMENSSANRYRSSPSWSPGV